MSRQITASIKCPRCGKELIQKFVPKNVKAAMEEVGDFYTSAVRQGWKNDFCPTCQRSKAEQEVNA